MDSILNVKEALVARSKTTTLDDLKSQGRRSVKVIRPEHIAAMVEEAVQKAVADSGHMSREEVDKLVDRSKEEFRSVIKEREAQLAHLREAMRQAEDLKAERVQLQASLQDLTAERDALAEKLRELEGQASQGQPGVAVAGGADLMMKLMNEVAELKANMMHGSGGGGDAAGVTAALDKIAGSLDQRLEKFGRKMGISSAVEAGQVNFDGLFDKQVEGKDFESNMDSVQVKKKSEGGIAANLERLKKLKGDG